MSRVTDTEDGGNVTVATLIRGKTYTFHDFDPETNKSEYHGFERNVPTPVSDELADKLEDLTEEVEDRDGDMITKDIFRVERDAPARAVAPAKKKARFRIVREEIEDRPVLRAPARKPLAAPVGKKAGTFGSRRAG